MFSAVMRPNTRNWPSIALLLALLLPLQSFAAISGCAPPLPATHHAQHPAQTVHEHCAEHASRDSAAHPHGCCDCCIAAVGQATLDWTPPRTETPQLSLPVVRAPLMISLDRLDRPPRTLPL
jgi:hypothetical protein